MSTKLEYSYIVIASDHDNEVYIERETITPKTFFKASKVEVSHFTFYLQDIVTLVYTEEGDYPGLVITFSNSRCLILRELGMAHWRFLKNKLNDYKRHQIGAVEE